MTVKMTIEEKGAALQMLDAEIRVARKLRETANHSFAVSIASKMTEFLSDITIQISAAIGIKRDDNNILDLVEALMLSPDSLRFRTLHGDDAVKRRLNAMKGCLKLLSDVATDPMCLYNENLSAEDYYMNCPELLAISDKDSPMRAAYKGSNYALAHIACAFIDFFGIVLTHAREYSEKMKQLEVAAIEACNADYARIYAS